MRIVLSAAVAVALYHAAFGLVISSQIRWDHDRNLLDQAQFVATWPLMMACTASPCRSFGLGAQYGAVSPAR